MKSFLVSLSLICAVAGMGQTNPVPAPEIALQNTAGSVTKLSSLKGKVVLVDFWASWCGPCRESIPELKELYKKYRDKGFEIYSVSLDHGTAEWKRAIQYYRMNWPHVFDAEGKAATAYKVQYIPSTFLLNKEGKIVAANAHGKELEQLISQLLN